MGKDKPYKEKDLIDEADKPIHIAEPSSRAVALEKVLPNRTKIRTNRTGTYQGKMSFVIYLDGEIWLHNDYYGSCSGCDEFLANPDGWTEDMLRKAYCFDNKEKAIEYLEDTDDYSWEEILTDTIDTVRELEIPKLEEAYNSAIS